MGQAQHKKQIVYLCMHEWMDVHIFYSQEVQLKGSQLQGLEHHWALHNPPTPHKTPIWLEGIHCKHSLPWCIGELREQALNGCGQAQWSLVLPRQQHEGIHFVRGDRLLELVMIPPYGVLRGVGGLWSAQWCCKPCSWHPLSCTSWEQKMQSFIHACIDA